MTAEPAAAPAKPPLVPHLQPIADRYGRDLFDAALRIASLTSALDQLAHRTRTSETMQGLVMVIMSSLGDLNTELIAAKGWHLDDVVECIKEIGEAREAQRPKIVRPS